MASQNSEFDFDFIVIGSGFGGSVSAHRLVEKGYRVAVMEMGRRWTPENLPKTSWSLHRWFWRPGIAHALLPARHHSAWMCGGRRVDYVCLYHAASS